MNLGVLFLLLHICNDFWWHDVQTQFPSRVIYIPRLSFVTVSAKALNVSTHSQYYLDCELVKLLIVKASLSQGI